MVDRAFFVVLAAFMCQTSAQCIGSLNSNQFLTNQLVSSCNQQPTQVVTSYQQPQIVSPCNQQSQIITVQPQACGQLVSSNQLVPPCQQNQLVAANQQPVYATTIIDNSVSNALANALQLLIVSDLIESTLNARNVDVVTPCGVVETDLYNQYLSPCVETYPVVQEVVQSCGCGSYPVEIVQNYAPVQAFTPPLAAEVVFPSSIPAQLTCNFGYVPSAQPVVQVVGIEPMSSYGSCGCGASPYYY